ncbi:MAG: CocE/NonD family hydrolase [Alphaproteobacteria bacterium]|nr:MAG: CocE/NonD family hydrolase [Alphaproteobacteria bacterium]
MTVLADVMVPMRDGVRLATDIYLPSGGQGPWPVILERTPYGKENTSRSERTADDQEPRRRTEVARAIARHGYAVVMQDVRGRYGSEGVFSKYLNEAEDGFDTMAWIVAQPWCDGKIGTMGVSYGAHTQISAACLNPPGLAAMFLDSGGFASAYHGGIRRGGAFELKQVTWAYKHALLSPETKADPVRKAALEAVDLPAWFRDMPWSPGHSPLKAAPEYEAYLFEQWQNGTYGPYWQRLGLSAEGRYGAMPDVPVMILNSWYDPYVATSVANYQGFRDAHKAPVFLTMGPWTHGQRSVSFSGDVDFGPEAVFDRHFDMDYLAYRLAWFDHYLKGMPSPLFDEKKPVSLFVMGGGSGARLPSGRLHHGGRWRQFADWPDEAAPAFDAAALFLDADKGALVRHSPQVRSAWRDYVHDPRNPVPTIGGAVTSGEPLMVGGAFNQVEDKRFFGCSKPGRALGDRSDVLSFETAPLDADVTIIGNIVADLWVSSDCIDTDFCAKLVDVYPHSRDNPEGFAMNISDAILRLRYRDSWSNPELMEPGRIYRIALELPATANVFRKGHKIRLDIASSNFPNYDLNPNTGEAEGVWQTAVRARNRVYADAAHPSRLRFSVLKGGVS